MSNKISRRSFLKLAGSGLITVSSLTFHENLLAAVAKQKPEPPVKTISPMNLDEFFLNQLLQAALSRGGDFSEIYAHQQVQIRFRSHNGIFEAPEMQELSGIGARVLQGPRSGYAFCEDMTENTIRKAVVKASPNMSPTEATPPRPIEKRAQPQNCPSLKPGSAIIPQRKAEKLAAIEIAARKFDARIDDVSVQLVESSDYRMIANSHGIWVEDIVPLIYIRVEVTAKAAGKIGSGVRTEGAKMGYEFFDQTSPESLGNLAAQQAIHNLEATEIREGEFTVVLSNRCGLIYQAVVGYEAEGDSILSGVSPFSLAKGAPIASPLLSIIDDATISNGFGSFNIDDEGVPPQRTVIIRLGKLDKLLLTQKEARQMHELSTGSARRENHRHPPVASVANTFVAQGIAESQEVISETASGIYVAALKDNFVRIDSSRFAFPVQEAFKIENGKITEPIGGLILVGSAEQFLKNIEKIASDLSFCPHFRTKNGQCLSVTYGMPTMRLKTLTVRRYS